MMAGGEAADPAATIVCPGAPAARSWRVYR
jgi:hypothetical protein